MSEIVASPDLMFTYDGGAFTVDTRPVEQAYGVKQWESYLVLRVYPEDKEVTFPLWDVAQDPDGVRSQQAHNLIVKLVQAGASIEEIEDQVEQLKKI